MKINFLKAFILLAVCSMAIRSSCNESFPVFQEKEYEMERFEGVRLGGVFRIEIHQAEKISVTAKGKKDHLQNLQLEVVNGILIASCGLENRNSQGTLLKITMPVLKSANLHGATSSVITGFNEQNQNLALNLSDSSKVVTDVDAKFLDLKMNDTSTLVLKDHLKDSEKSVKGSKRLLGRGGICGYGYHRVGWI